MSAPGYQIPRDPTAVVGTRTAAWIVDFLLVLLLAFALGPSPLSPLAEYTEVPDGMDMDDACERVRDVEDVSGCVVIGDRVYFTDASDALIQFLASLLLFVLVYVVWQGVSGLTPGKLLVGLRTVGEDGRPPGPLKAFIRSVLWIIDGLPCIPLVGFITALTSTGHRRVGDMAAKTFVVAKADMGRPVMVPGLTGGTYGTPTVYGGQPGYGTPMPSSAPWGTPPSSPGAPAPGAPSWGTPPGTPPAPGSPYPAADARPGPPTSPYGTPATPGTPGTPSGGYPAPAPAPASDVAGPTAPGQAPANDASSFGESGDPADADRPAGETTPSDVEAAAAAPSTSADQAEKEGEGDGAGEDASPSGSEAAAESSEPGAPTESAGETAAAPTVEQTYSPQWDAARGAYIQWDPNRSRWLQWDDTAKEWKPI